MEAELHAMGALDASFGMLFDAVSAIQSFVSVFIWVYTLLIFFYIISSWIQVPYSLSGVQRFLRDVCEPYLRIFRRVLPPLGPLDLSPIVAVIVLVAIERILATVVFPRLH